MLVLGVLVLLVAAIGAAVGYYFYEGRSREVTGSSTEEFLPEENPADTTTPATTTTPPPKPALEAQWPTYGRDIQRTHVSPAKHRPPYRQVWMHRARHYIEFPPVVAYDKIFVAQQRGRFYALNAETGKQLWNQELRPLRSRVTDRLAGCGLPGVDARASLPEAPGRRTGLLMR